jgi:TrmH family RNA methyltransferase
MEITSFSNPRIKQLRKLQDKKERIRSGLYYIEGLRIIGDALQHQAAFDSVYYAPELLRSEFGHGLLQQLEQKGIPVFSVSAAIFEHFAAKDHPQGIAAVMKMQENPLPAVDIAKRQIWVGLDEIADPGNLGTILRTQDATNGAGLFLLGNCTDAYDHAVLRASMGAFFTQPISSLSPKDMNHWKQKNGVMVIGASDAAKVDYQSYQYPVRMVLLMGSERQGLHPEPAALCDEIVSIPMAGYADSLNLSVATAVILYEIFNQHRRAGLIPGGKQ